MALHESYDGGDVALREQYGGGGAALREQYTGDGVHSPVPQWPCAVGDRAHLVSAPGRYQRHPTDVYTGMTEREKMLRGELYDAEAPELAAARRRCRDLLHRLNHSRDGEEGLRRDVFRKLFGAHGEQLWIEPPFYCDYGSNVTLGDGVYFNFNCVVLDPAEVYIGNDVLFGPAVQLYTATHPLGWEERRMRKELARPIRIGSDVWLGGGAIVQPGVTIGDRSVIGAGSVVTKDVPPGVFAAGNPCRVLREV